MAENNSWSGRQRDTEKNVKRGRGRQSLECGHDDGISDESREARLSIKWAEITSQCNVQEEEAKWG
jgi:hypothetical protein